MLTGMMCPEDILPVTLLQVSMTLLEMSSYQQTLSDFHS